MKLCLVPPPRFRLRRSLTLRSMITAWAEQARLPKCSSRLTRMTPTVNRKQVKMKKHVAPQTKSIAPIFSPLQLHWQNGAILGWHTLAPPSASFQGVRLQACEPFVKRFARIDRELQP